jgi:hypothetical protein
MCLNKISKLGIHCLSDWINWAIGANFQFFKSEKEFYSHLVTNYRNAVLYLSIEDGKMTVSQDLTGYTICRMLVQDNDYKEIIKAKYYEHMSIMIQELIDQYMHKLNTLEEAFIRTIVNEFLSTDYFMSLSDICKVVKSASFSHCVGLTTETDSTWNKFFASFRETFLDIDNALIKLAQIFAKECSNQVEANQEFVYKYYEHFLPMIKKLSKFRATYNHATDKAFNRLIFRDRITPAGAMSCTHQFATQHLSTKDSVRQLVLIYNTKIEFLAQFANFVQLKSYAHLLLNKPTAGRKQRFKRHFLTHPLSVLTGLADAETVQKIAEQNNKVIVAEQMDAEHILALDNRTNAILGSLQMQSSKIGTLYKDEDKLEKELNLLLHDEQNMTRQLSVIMSSLEALSDLQLEYNSVTFLLNSIEVMIVDLEMQVNSIIAQDLNAFMTPGSTSSTIIKN